MNKEPIDPTISAAATAPQRCEAFLKAVGKWKEGV